MSAPHVPLRDRVRVVVVEDHGLFAESLELALTMAGYDARWLVPTEDDTARSVLSQVLRHHPQVVLLDLDLGPLGSSAPLITPLARSGVKVLVVTASVDQARWGECLARGARGVLSKSRPLNAVQAAVRLVSEGRPVMEVAEREALVLRWRERNVRTQHAAERLSGLTRREQEVLGHLMAGRTVNQIAVLGVVAEATVRTQVKSILSKLGVSSQIAAVGLAHEVGWRPPVTTSAVRGRVDGARGGV